MLKKVVIIGPESTGKSTLCEMLAQHFNTQWCPEFAREYLMTNGKAYDFEDLLTIAKGQMALEEEYVLMAGADKVINPQEDLSTFQPINFSTDQLLFIDTDLYVMKVWCEYVFSDCHNWILRRIAERPYDLYLLCKPDLPWVKDALREYPDERPRQELYHMYRDLLIQQHTPWIEVKGSYEERFEQAREAVAQILN